jgi:hypothetical protein
MHFSHIVGALASGVHIEIQRTKIVRYRGARTHKPHTIGASDSPGKIWDIT